MSPAFLYVRLALTVVMFAALIAQFSGMRAAASGVIDKARSRLRFAAASHVGIIAAHAVLGALQRRSWDIILAMIWLLNFYLCRQTLKKLASKK